MRRRPAWLAAWLAAGLALAGGGRATVEAGMRFVAGAAADAQGLPDDILRGLATDDRVLDCREGLVGGRSAFQPDWVVAHRVDLDGDGVGDWLVEGRHACLRDAGSADWWLYAEGDAGRRLLMATGRAAAVEVLPSRSHGLRDLRLVDADGTAGVARFNGAAYVRAAASG